MQELVVPIAISSLVVLFIVFVFKVMVKAKGGDTMGHEIKEFASVSFDVLYTMSANLAGGALLAKILQMVLTYYEKRSGKSGI